MFLQVKTDKFADIKALISISIKMQSTVSIHNFLNL